MGTIDQITYRARGGSAGVIYEAATSLRDKAEIERWQRRLEPLLRVGRPPGRAYLNFGTQAACIRWYAESASHFDWQYALVMVAQPDVLTGDYALELPDLDLPELYQGGGQVTLLRTEHGRGHDTIEARACSADAIQLLIPLLAHALRGERRVTMPWTEPSLPEAALWGLVSILEMIGDTRPVSFHTYVASSSRDSDTPGLFVSFRPDAKAVLPPDPGYWELAADLAARFADGPAALRQTLAQSGMLEPADDADRISRLLSLWPRAQAGSTYTGGTTTVTASFDDPAPVSFTEAAPSSGTGWRGRHTGQDTPGQVVLCPMCLHEIQDWNTLDYWRWDAAQEAYVELPVQPDLSDTQQEHYLHGARVRCPAPQGDAGIGPHYLPAGYGRFGPPVVLGFVGLTHSGKSHLLASMVGAIVGRELEKHYGISTSPLDHAWHRRFMDAWVSPLLKHDKVLPGTREGRVVEFADAFLMTRRGGQERVVALFDVAGGDLARLDETKQFLWIANGLFFVVDPDRLSAQWAEDETFGNVLDIVRKRTRRGPVSAAIVLNKADMVRFDEPVDRWLRSAGSVARGGALDSVEFLRESADVYAYLDARNALAMAEPYEVCDKVTLHIASPTGGADTGEGGVYPRGVTPRRVLRPLVAMLAMTGVLTGPEAEKVGV
jgi:Double-GTPase 2